MKQILALGALLAAVPAAGQSFSPPAWRKPTFGSPFGVNAHDLVWNAPNPETQAIVDGAVPWVRVDFNWLSIEPGQGSFDWTVTDGIVDAATQNGFNVYATLAYTPQWATDGAQGPGVPRDPNDWDAFVFAVVDRYKDRVKVWGLWNEPNLTQFWAGTRQQYIDIVVKVGAAAAKRADPGCLVAGPELAHLKSADWSGWLSDVLTQVGGDFDVITHHKYGSDAADVANALDGPQWPWDPPNVRDVITQAGYASKPFWLTETGWHTDQVGEATQATDYTALLDEMLKRPWWNRVFFYELQDDPNITEQWGILRADHSHKPSFDAFAQYISGHTPVPVAQVVGPAYAGAPVTFDGSGSHDPDNAIAGYEWDFDESDGVGVDATGASATHVYAAPGSYTALLTVRDPTGIAIFTRFTVDVEPAPAGADAGAPDAGPIADAGADDAGSDAGALATDAGGAGGGDAGAPPRADAGQGSGAAGGAVDSGAGAAATRVHAAGGCGCSAPGAGALAWLLFAVAFASRPRRAACAPGR